jgi:hypothetical protein
LAWFGFERYFLRWKGAVKTWHGRVGEDLVVTTG